MKKLVISLSLVIFFVGSAFGSPDFEFTPYSNSDVIPSPIEMQPIQSPVDPESAIPGPLIYRENYLSSAAYYTHFGKNLPFDPVYEYVGTEPLGSEGLAPDSSISGTHNMVSDIYQDAEPAVMAYNSNGTIYKTTTYIKIPDGMTPRIYYSTTADYVTFWRNQLPMPAGYQYSADPLMAKNAINGGISPGRIYVTGIIYNPPQGTQIYGIPNGIAVWHTDDGGRSWSQPTISEFNPNDSSAFLDKPAIAVSQHSGSLGYVYEANVYFTSAANYIHVNRSTDGGVTFASRSQVVSTTDNINGAQVVVDPNTGYLYVLWTDFKTNSIKLAISTNLGISWSQPETAPETGYKANGFIKGSVRIGSLPMARYNWVANKVSLVWSEWQQGSPDNCNSLPPGACNTDVYYISRSSTGVWSSKARVNDSQMNDQFMPALDFDSSGNLIVTFYDRRDDPNNLLYHEYMSHIDSAGNRLEANQRVSTFQSNPGNYNSGQYKYFIGDYQDIWDQTISGVNNYFSSWVGIPVRGDIYLSTILP